MSSQLQAFFSFIPRAAVYSHIEHLRHGKIYKFLVRLGAESTARALPFYCNVTVTSIKVHFQTVYIKLQLSHVIQIGIESMRHASGSGYGFGGH